MIDYIIHKWSCPQDGLDLKYLCPSLSNKAGDQTVSPDVGTGALSFIIIFSSFHILDLQKIMLLDKHTKTVVYKV